MLRERVFRSKGLVLGVVGAVSLLFFPHEAFAQTSQAGGAGAMMGFIYAEDMKSPVEGAVVKLRNVKDGKEFASTATDKNGLYAIKSVAEGRYILGVSSPKGDFNFDYQIMVKANETAKLALALKPGVPAPAGKPAPAGAAGGTPFFLTPLGILIIVGAAALLLYGGYQLFGVGEEKSPSKK